MDSFYIYIVAGGLVLFGIAIIPDIIEFISEKFCKSYPDDMDQYRLF